MRHYVIPRYIYIVSHRFDNLVIWIVGKIVEWRSWKGDKNICSFMRSIVLISIDERERERDSINNLFERLIIYFTIKGIFFYLIINWNINFIGDIFTFVERYEICVI